MSSNSEHAISESDFKSGVYRHFKGAHYLALGLARHDNTDETLVVYIRLYERPGHPMSARLLSVWNETVVLDGKTVPRFEYLGPRE